MNTEEACRCLCHKFGISASSNEFSTFFSKHLYNNTALSIADFLAVYNIPSKSYFTTPESLINITCPFLVQVKNDNDLFGIVYKIYNNKVYWYNPFLKRNEQISKENFEKQFTGFIQSYDFNIKSSLSKRLKIKIDNITKSIFNKLIYLIIGGLACFYIIEHLIPHFITGDFINFILVIIGVLSCLSILKYEEGQKTLLEKLCHVSKKTDCQSVIFSEGSTIFGVHLSTIGFSYFFGLLMSLAIDTNLDVKSLIWLYIPSSFFILYSLYYQIKIAKSICTMCMTILLIILLLLINSLSSSTLIFSTKDVYDLYVICISMFISFFSMQPYQAEKKINKELSQEVNKLYRLKQKEDIFLSLLYKEKKVKQMPNIGINVGDDTAAYKITILTNPSCYWCQALYKETHNLIKYRTDLSVKFIFNVSLNDSENDLLFVRTVLAMQSTSDVGEMHKAFDYWYTKGVKKPQLFKEKFYIDDDKLKEQDGKIQEMIDWCNLENNYATPTIIVNEHYLPSFYELKDLFNIV